MFDDSRSFISRAFLQSVFDLDYKAYAADGTDEKVLTALTLWDSRRKLNETQAEGAFIQTFFVELWGFHETGRRAIDGHTALPKFAVRNAGASGGSGEADLALGWFKGEDEAQPQVLCEFKDIRSGLDTKQNRKGANLTPVEQCLNYVRHARRSLFGNEPVQPWWGLVTDMNEFRLYWWDRAPQQFMRFKIRGNQDLFERDGLISNSDDARFDRFLFWKLMQRDMLIASSGRPALWRLVERQWLRESKIEDEFYAHYKGVRERLFKVLRIHNPQFTGSATDLLRTSQKLLDRFIFAFYCEDMGERMLFPPQFIREYIQTRCNEDYYDTEGSEFWVFFRRLFQTMNTGGKLGQKDVPHINGGLFDDDALIDQLQIPNHVFAAPMQGLNDASLEKDRETLFYLSARYNYAAKGDAKESLTLYTLGRIFEQSITELEYRVGELEGRETLAKLSKRKRDGVYYTPEWVVNYLVEETLAPWFAAAREAALAGDGGEDAAAAVNRYESALRQIRIVDPACGSGAFLISAFRRVLQERLAVEREKQALAGGLGAAAVLDEKAIIADILGHNIYGADINPSSVEIAKLALWLHSARANSPLSSLDHCIRCGNSLVGPDIWTMRPDTPENRARINPFDWREAFPEVFAAGGFDIVLGNPPYVKLQNLMKVDADVVAYLQARRADGETYESAQTGNFDLYLPFIEKGLRLLALGGRMAYIAPSLWAVNEYGAGLQGLLARTRQLDRWVDFKSHQVFDEAITYTALQFFTQAPNAVVRIAAAPGGEVSDIDWNDPRLRVEATELSDSGSWLMVTGEDRAVIRRLQRDCLRLDDPRITTGITVGIQTSADSIYHLRKLGPGRYMCVANDEGSYEVRIEDAVMRPLVSGEEAKRYEAPHTDTYLLFPYRRDAKGNVVLIPAEAFSREYPLSWNYLLSFEQRLRGRENSKMNNERWYSYNYPKNLDKQDRPKIMVPRLVRDLVCSVDHEGKFWLDNVDVGGVLSVDESIAGFLLGCLNSAVTNFVFRRTSKPFQNDYRSANKQFIAPLPVPHANENEQQDIGGRARALQVSWTHRRDLLLEAEARLSVLGRARHGARWLWPDLPDMAALKDQAPRALRAHEKTEWAHDKLAELEEAELAALQGVLDGGSPLSAGFTDGELRLYAGGEVVLGKIFLDPPEGALAEAYWRFLLLRREARDAKSVASSLRRVPTGPETPAARQFTERVAALVAETQFLRTAERGMNERLYELYRLSPEERLLVEKDCAARAII